MMSNTGATGFNGNVGSMGSELNISGGISDPLGASAGGGILRVAGAGGHYANKWNGNENHLVSDYTYGNLFTRPSSSYIISQILSDSVYTQRQQASSINRTDRHAMNADYDFIPDSVSAFRFSIGGNNMQGHNEFSSTGSSEFNDTLVNSSRRNIRSDVQNQLFRGSVMWRISAKRKKGRTFSLMTGISRQDNSAKGYLYSLNSFYRPDGDIRLTDTIDQRKLVTERSLVVNNNINYTEPLWKNTVLALAYGLTFNNSQSILSTYDRGDGKYEAYIDSLSNRYQNNVLTQRTTLNIQVQDKSYGLTIGGDLLHYDYKQTDEVKDSLLRLRYLNFTPRISGRWNIDDYQGFNADYSGNTQQASIAQLQPVQNNNDPLHITLGNPHLRPGFHHNFSLGYHNFKPFIFNAAINYGFSTTGISTRTLTDSLGRQISQAVNVSGSHNIALNLSLSKRLKPIDLDVDFNGSAMYSRSLNYINQYLNRNDNAFFNGRINLKKFVPDKYNFDISGDFSYTYSQSSINKFTSPQYWAQRFSGTISVFPMPGFEINTHGWYTWRQKLDQFDKNAVFQWNAYILKNFLRNQLTVRWQINDILNQNAGIDRRTYGNQTTENTYNVIGRYWLLSVSWRFMHHRK